MARVGPEERLRIVALLRDDKTPYAVAKETGRSRPTVCKIARDEGMELNVNLTKRAAEARRDYALAGRLELNNHLFDKLRTMSETVEQAKDFKDLVISYGVLVEKRRLDDGDVTDRTESRKGDIRDVFEDLDRKYGLIS